MNAKNAAHSRSATRASAKQTSLLVLLVKRIFAQEEKTGQLDLPAALIAFFFFTEPLTRPIKVMNPP